MIIHEAAEMYLESIYVLSLHQDLVRPVDVAREMGYSKPTVSEWMAKLRDAKLVEPDTGTGLHLTEAGTSLARSVYERHVVLSGVFESLGVSPQTAADDACRVEHYISDETFEALKKHWQSNKKSIDAEN